MHTWLTGIRKGQNGAISVLIMPDGRMELLAALPDTKPKIFHMSDKKLRSMITWSFEGGSEEHVKNLLAFAKEYNLLYLPYLKWKSVYGEIK